MNTFSEHPRVYFERLDDPDRVEGIAALKAELEPEIMRVVFKDAGFPDDVVKTNTVQILRQAGIDDVKSL